MIFFECWCCYWWWWWLLSFLGVFSIIMFVQQVSHLLKPGWNTSKPQSAVVTWPGCFETSMLHKLDDTAWKWQHGNGRREIIIPIMNIFYPSACEFDHLNLFLSYEIYLCTPEKGQYRLPPLHHTVQVRKSLQTSTLTVTDLRTVQLHLTHKHFMLSTLSWSRDLCTTYLWSTYTWPPGLFVFFNLRISY